jgi:hypothetical protein
VRATSPLYWERSSFSARGLLPSKNLKIQKPLLLRAIFVVNQPVIEWNTLETLVLKWKAAFSFLKLPELAA